MFEELYIDNYFPSVLGEKETHIHSISTLKIKIFNAVVGSDTKTLTSDETLESFFKDELAKLSKETQSWDTEHREVYDSVKDDENTLKEVRAIPMRSRVVRTDKEKQVTVAVGIEGDHVVCAKTEDGECSIVSIEQALTYFKADIDEVGQKADEQFGAAFQTVKEKLFEKPQIGQLAGNRLHVTNILRILIEDETSYVNYCRDLQTVVRDLDDIPDGQLKQIIKLGKKVDGDEKEKKNEADKLCEAIMQIAPEHQVKVSLEKAGKEELASSVILFTEEHRV
jgi:hypothetical protein